DLSGQQTQPRRSPAHPHLHGGRSSVHAARPHHRLERWTHRTKGGDPPMSAATPGSAKAPAQQKVSLYDEPGPKTRRNIRIWSVVVTLLLLALIGAGLAQFGSKGQLDADKWTPFLSWPI